MRCRAVSKGQPPPFHQPAAASCWRPCNSDSDKPGAPHGEPAPRSPSPPLSAPRDRSSNGRRAAGLSRAWLLRTQHCDTISPSSDGQLTCRRAVRKSSKIAPQPTRRLPSAVWLTAGTSFEVSARWCGRRAGCAGLDGCRPGVVTQPAQRSLAGSALTTKVFVCCPAGSRHRGSNGRACHANLTRGTQRVLSL